MTIKKDPKKLQEIFTAAYQDCSKALVKYAFFRINDYGTSQDLVQETFMKTWNYLIKGGEIVTMKAFLYHVLNNLVVDQYRKHKTVSLDGLLEKGFEPSEDNSKRVIDTLDGKAAFPLIERLPPKYQKVMHMRYEDDMSLEEMSHATKESKNTTAVQVHRGLEKLKILYNSYPLQHSHN